MKEICSKIPVSDTTNNTAGISKQMRALTSLRFIAAVCIVLHHLRGSFGLPTDAYAGWNLSSAVSFFFVLSGFVLTYAHPSLSSRREVLAFLIRRWFRIWPLHIACLSIFVVLIPQLLLPCRESFQGFLEILANSLLVQAWIPASRYYFSFNPVSWTISTEWFFYLCFPFLLFLFMRKRAFLVFAFPFIILVLTLAFSAKFAPGDYSGLNNSVTSHGLIYISPLTRLFEFSGGMYLQTISTRFKPNGLKRYMWLLQIAAIVLAVWYVSPGSMLFDRAGTPHVVRIWRGYSGGLLVWSFVIWSFSSPYGWPSRLLSNRILVLLGEISFATYLVHYPIAHVIAHRFWDSLQLSGFSQLALYLVLVLTASFALHFLIEVPARWIGKLLAKSIFKAKATENIALNNPQNA